MNSESNTIAESKLWGQIIDKCVIMHNHIQREAHIRMFKKEKNNCGFTLAELLIVVAIIAVLVAVSIPIFTSQLKKARLAVDHSAMRDAYALMQIANNTQEVEINGVRYSYADVKNLNDEPRYINLYLAEDCNSFIMPSRISLGTPDGAYAFKDTGCDGESAICDICSLWNRGGFHYKNGGIQLQFNKIDNRLDFAR